MRRLILTFFAAMLPGLLVVASRADAASIFYSTTDLGLGYSHLQTGANGTITGVTTADGSATYAFSKAPVTAINEMSVNEGDAHLYALDQTLTMQDGVYKVGYNTNFNFDDGQSHGGLNGYIYPTFEPHDSTWFAGGVSVVFPMLTDMNVQGQVVGQGLKLPIADVQVPTSYYAAFSAVGLQPHGGDASISDNLNNYIASLPGVSLTSAVAIDDLGRIVTIGSDGHEYLLTPLSLGGVEPVPEPTTLMIIGGGGILWVARPLRRCNQESNKRIKRLA